MIKQLIVNADDFGMTQANTIGILVAHSQGIVTSTTCMMNMPYAHFALKQAQNYPHLGVGVHLVLTVGRPLIDGAHSYTDANGNFIRQTITLMENLMAIVKNYIVSGKHRLKNLLKWQVINQHILTHIIMCISYLGILKSQKD